MLLLYPRYDSLLECALKTRRLWIYCADIFDNFQNMVSIALVTVEGWIGFRPEKEWISMKKVLGDYTRINVDKM